MDTVSFPPRRSQNRTYSLSLSVDAGSHLLTSVTSAAAAAVRQVSSHQHPNCSSPQLLTLNLAQQGILTSDPVEVKMSGYGLFVGQPSSQQEQIESACYQMWCAVGVKIRAGVHFETMEEGSAASSSEGDQAKWMFIWRTCWLVLQCWLIRFPLCPWNIWGSQGW